MRSSRSLTPPEPTPLRKQAHYAWVIEPPEEGPVHQLVYIGHLAAQSLSDQFVPDQELIQLQTAFRAHYYLSQLADTHEDQWPEAILCDLELPDGSAFELFDRIRRMPHLSTIPFFAIAPTIDKNIGIQALQHGLDDVYGPSLQRDHLETRIHFLHMYHRSLKISDKADIPATDFTPSEPKRMLDVWMALLGLMLLGPLMLLIALLIKLTSRGPVLDITQCAGTGYQVFPLYKFRTTLCDVSEDQAEKHRSPLGKWLARYNLDELPQLINILKGDMSLVGNRPLPLEEAEQLTTDQWSKRFLAPAGVTGLWQIARRTQKHLSDADRRQMDIEYADDASFWNDIRIIIKTIVILLRRSTK